MAALGPRKRPFVCDGSHVVLRDIAGGLTVAMAGAGSEAIRVGKCRIASSALLSHPLGSTLRFVGGEWKRTKRMCMGGLLQDGEERGETTTNNRELLDNNEAQTLGAEQIMQLKEQGLAGAALIDTIVGGSATFASKTAFSQEKYIRKKQRKHVQELTLLEPSVMNIAEAYWKNNQQKIGGLRFDYLSQMLGVSDVRSGQRVLCLDHSLGLLLGAVALRLDGSGELLRILDKGVGSKVDAQMDLGCRRTSIISDVPISLLLSDNPLEEAWVTPPVAAQESQAGGKADYAAWMAERRAKAAARRDRFCRLRVQKADALLGSICARKAGDGSQRDTQRLVTVTIKRICEEFLRPDGKLVLFCATWQPLAHMQVKLQASEGFVHVRLEELFTREHQILPQRTHPFMTSTAQHVSGFLLSAIRVAKS